jgi:hypothetical protein
MATPRDHVVTTGHGIGPSVIALEIGGKTSPARSAPAPSLNCEPCPRCSERTIMRTSWPATGAEE